MSLSLKRSAEIMERSNVCFPGGVNSPVRSFSSVGGMPIVFSHGLGKHLTDVDGNTYIDFCGSWGPHILGYSHPKIIDAIEKQCRKSTSFGAPSEGEVLLAEKIKEFVPKLEMMRFVNSGTEATMSAIRAARAATGRNKFLKFEGCYHGHSDCLLVKAGSGLATLGNPSSAGVPFGTTQDTLTAIYNNKQSVQEAFDNYGSEIAAIIVEPVAANMGLILPEDGFLQFLRDITNKHGSILIFDEVMTGFRIAKGGCAEKFGVTPDLWTFGKIIGGGLPAAAYGGKREIMSHIAPLGRAYQAGTLSGNPLATAAGLAALNEIERINAYEILENIGLLLDEIVQNNLSLQLEQKKLVYTRVGSFFCFFFGTSLKPKNFNEVSTCNMDIFNKIYHKWLQSGIYLGPSGFETGFLSVCHEKEDLERMVNVISSHLS